jgi:hypothetical protein
VQLQRAATGLLTRLNDLVDNVVLGLAVAAPGGSGEVLDPTYADAMVPVFDEYFHRQSARRRAVSASARPEDAEPVGNHSMTPVLTRQLDDILGRPDARPTLKCESQLRVAAATLRHARPGEITATTVVGVLGRDDQDAFNTLLAEIASEHDLDARVRLHVGSYAVRFSRRTDRG